MRSWCSGVVMTMRPNPSDLKNVSSMSSGPRPHEGYGVRIIDAPLNRSALALAKPLTSLPAIGCPPTNVHLLWKANFSSALHIALFPLFEAPVQMLCDSPTQYRTAPECTAFLTKVPTVWDATVGVAGEIGQYAAVARRKGKDWWLGAITNWDARSLSMPTDFLGGGEWNVEVFEDAPDANVNAEHYVRRTFKIRSGEPLKANLAPGGGFAARFSR